MRDSANLETFEAWDVREVDCILIEEHPYLVRLLLSLFAAGLLSLTHEKAVESP